MRQEETEGRTAREVAEKVLEELVAVGKVGQVGQTEQEVYTETAGGCRVPERARVVRAAKGKRARERRERRTRG